NIKLAAWRIYSVAPIASASDLEFLFGKVLAVLVGVTAILATYFIWKYGRLRRLDALLAAAIVFAFLSIAGPDAVNGGGFIRMRLVSYFYLTLILWISAQSIPKTMARAVACLAIGISVLFYTNRAPLYAELDRQIDEYLSVESFIEPNTTVFAVSFA